MRLLVVSAAFPPLGAGGGGVAVARMADAWRDRVEVTVFAGAIRSELPAYAVFRSQIEGHDAFVVNLPETMGFEDAWRGDPRVGDRFARVLAHVAPDAVSFHAMQGLGSRCLEVAAAAKVPFHVALHDFWWVCERQFMMRSDGRLCGMTRIDGTVCERCSTAGAGAHRRLDALRSALGAARFVFAPSEAVARVYAETLGPGVRIERIGYGVPHLDLPKREGKEIVFGYAGGPLALKGWTDLLEAGRGLDIRFAAPDGPAGREMRRTARRVPGTWRATNPFPPSAVGTFLADVDAVVSPSRVPEAYGLLAREALAAGRGAIFYDHGGLADIPDHPLAIKVPLSEGAAGLGRAMRRFSRSDAAPPEIPLVSDQAHRLLDLVLRDRQRAAV